MNRTAAGVLAALLAIVAVLAVVVAVLYFHDTAHDLPSFLPGHADGRHGHFHYKKRGAAAVAVAVVAFVLAGGALATGRRRRAAT